MKRPPKDYLICSAIAAVCLIVCAAFSYDGRRNGWLPLVFAPGLVIALPLAAGGGIHSSLFGVYLIAASVINAFVYGFPLLMIWRVVCFFSRESPSNRDGSRESGA